MPNLRSRRLASGYIDYFNSLGMWSPLIGTFGVAAGGGLKALTQANQGNNLVTNGESWTGGPPPTGWSNYQVTSSSVNSAVDPGAPSGGVDNTAVKLVVSGAAAGPCLYGAITSVAGASYKAATLAYAKSTNSIANDAAIVFGTSTLVQVSAMDVWQSISTTLTNALAIQNLAITFTVVTHPNGDTSYFDSTSLYCQSSLLLYLGATTPNATYVWDMVQPATGVVPKGFVVRYTGLLDYWKVRVKPNTAGNDTDIVEVVAGVETVRATADIDWTANATDQVRIILNGAVITVEAKKSGASAWSAATSYSTMATGLTQSRIGYMSYGLPGTSEVAKFEVVA